MPQHEYFNRKLCISVDAEGYGRRDDRAQQDMQEALLRILAAAAGRAHLDRATWTRQGVGDEELSLIPLGPGEPLVVDDLPRQLDAELSRVNRGRSPENRIRLRMAMNVGVAYPADNGFAGQGVVVVSRLLNSTPVRRALKVARTANLALIVSAGLFDDVVCQGHTTLGPGDFRRVDISEKEYQGHAWLRVPGVDVNTLDLSATTDGVAEATDPAGAASAAADRSDGATAPTPPAAAVMNSFHGEVDARYATFGFSGGARG
ncbi:hypothetical protein [Micromonospora sp. WMMD708]|uniref:hypothetical protein n=1 Tax=Micromonospora sp. WMMD708 TaxID=3403464 RepID=UPI003BF51CCE